MPSLRNSKYKTIFSIVDAARIDKWPNLVKVTPEYNFLWNLWSLIFTYGIIRQKPKRRKSRLEFLNCYFLSMTKFKGLYTALLVINYFPPDNPSPTYLALLTSPSLSLFQWQMFWWASFLQFTPSQLKPTKPFTHSRFILIRFVRRKLYSNNFFPENGYFVEWVSEMMLWNIKLF